MLSKVHEGRWRCSKTLPCFPSSSLSVSLSDKHAHTYSSTNVNCLDEITNKHVWSLLNPETKSCRILRWKAFYTSGMNWQMAQRLKKGHQKKRSYAIARGNRGQRAKDEVREGHERGTWRVWGQGKTLCKRTDFNKALWKNPPFVFNYICSHTLSLSIC